MEEAARSLPPAAGAASPTTTAVAATPDSKPAASSSSSPQQQQPSTPPLTPLQLRQWQRAAQRSVRLALTAFKAGRSKAQAATDDGTAAATQLTNSVLTARYVPAMQLPQALQGVAGLQAAAVEKLGRRQHQHLQELQQAVQQVAAAVAAMELALADVQAQLGGQQQQQQQQEGGGSSMPQHSTPSSLGPLVSPPSSAAQCGRMPVFHLLTLPQAAGMLQRVLAMHQQDLQLKQQVLQSFTTAVVGSPQPAPAGAAAAAAAASGGAAEEAGRLKRHLTVLLTCWMSKPHVEDEEVAQLLQVLTDEMTGF